MRLQSETSISVVSTSGKLAPGCPLGEWEGVASESDVGGAVEGVDS